MNRLAILHQQLKKSIGGRALPFLSIAGNVFTVKDDGNEDNVSAMDKDNGNTVYVDLHVIDASPYMSKTYYPAKYDPDAEAVAPTCYSNDGFRPAEDATEKQCDLCSQCPHNAWGSKITESGKRGKACNDAWKTAVIVPEHHEEKVIQFRIPPASLQPWLAYIGTFNDYDYPGKDRKMNVADAITRVYFESGKNGFLNFMAMSLIEPDSDEYNRAQELVENKSTEIFIGIDNISTEKQEEMLQLAPPSNAPQLEAPKPKPVLKTVAKIAAPVVEEEEQTDEEEEIAPQPVKKAMNSILPSEMRTKKMTATPAPAAVAPIKKAASTNSKAPVSDAMKLKLKSFMKMT